MRDMERIIQLVQSMAERVDQQRQSRLEPQVLMPPWSPLPLLVPTRNLKMLDTDIFQGFNSLNIVVEGEFNLPARLRVGWNKSIIGGRNGTIGTNGITIINASNVIVRNLRITGVLNNDCITIQNTTRVWIDHNDLSSNPNIIKNGPDLYVRTCLTSSHIQD